MLTIHLKKKKMQKRCAWFDGFMIFLKVFMNTGVRDMNEICVRDMNEI